MPCPVVDCAGSPSETYLKLLNAVAATKFKLVGPYPASNDAMLAMERGEVDGAFTSYNTLKVSRQDWLRDKKINILVQYGELSSELPDVLTRYREMGVLKRLRTTPVSPTVLLFAQLTLILLVSIVCMVLMVAVPPLAGHPSGDPHHRHAGGRQSGRRHLRRLADVADGPGCRQRRSDGKLA